MLANLLPGVLERSHAFAWELVQAIDGQDAVRSQQDDREVINRVPGVWEPDVFLLAGESLSTSIERMAQVKED